MVHAHMAEGVTSRTLRALNYAPEVSRLRARAGAVLEDLLPLRASPGAMFKMIDASGGHGEEFLTQSDVFASEPAGRTISTEGVPDLDLRRIRRYQVLIAGAGTLGETELYGRAMLADARLAGKLLTSDVVVLNASEESDEALFAYAFLCSPIGTRLVRSTSAGTKILRPRLDLLRTLPVPLPGAGQVEMIAQLVRDAVLAREFAHGQIVLARGIVENLPEVRVASEMCRDRKARCVAWEGELPTMTAWTYGSTGDALPYLREVWQGRVRDIVQPDGVFRGGRHVRVRCSAPHGVDFFSQRDVFLARPFPQRVALPDHALRETKCAEGWLLLGGQGTLGEGELFGRAAMVDETIAAAAVSEHLLRVCVRSGHTAAAFSFLSTPLGRRLLRSTAVGTKLLSLRPDLLLSLPFPDLSDAQAAAVSKHIAAATQARAAAATAESSAFRLIEEEVLPAWLA